MNNEKINQLSAHEQNLQNLLSQRQTFQSQLLETQSAKKELQSSKDAYKIIGNIMVLADNSELEKELDEKEKMLQLRIKSVEKQESEIRDKAQKLQKEIFDEMNKKKE